MEIRRLKDEDTPPALALVWQVFCEFEAPEYSEQGVAEFASFIEPASIKKRIESGELLFFGCFDGAELTGVIATRNRNHICLLFVKKEHHRKGIARRLYSAVLESCHAQGFKEITVNSSTYAAVAYRRLGFTATDSEQTINGIRFTSMRHTFS